MSEHAAPLHKKAPVLAEQLGSLLFRAAHDSLGTEADSMWLNYQEQSGLRREMINGEVVAWRSGTQWLIPRDQFVEGTLAVHPTLKYLRQLSTRSQLARAYESSNYSAAWWASTTLWSLKNPDSQSPQRYIGLLDFIHTNDEVLREPDNADVNAQSSPAASSVKEQLDKLPPAIIDFYRDCRNMYELFANDPGLLTEFVLTPSDRKYLPGRLLSSSQRRQQQRIRMASVLPFARPDNTPRNGTNGHQPEMPAVSTPSQVVAQDEQAFVA